MENKMKIINDILEPLKVLCLSAFPNDYLESTRVSLVGELSSAEWDVERCERYLANLEVSARFGRLENFSFGELMENINDNAQLAYLYGKKRDEISKKIDRIDKVLEKRSK
jgi:hypothetical protein